MSAILDPPLLAVLRRLHSEFIRARTARSRAIGPAAKAIGVLPITDDWKFDLGIRVEDGEVIQFSRDPPHDPQVEPASRRRLGILNDARFKHPELTGLIPPRPADAVECEYCGGRGERLGQDGVLRACFWCHLGWVPRSFVNESSG